jgi:hypothetical protein
LKGHMSSPTDGKKLSLQCVSSKQTFPTEGLLVFTVLTVSTTVSHWTTMNHTGGNDPRLDLSKVWIQNDKKILETFETGDYFPCLKMLTKLCRFQTVKRILIPFNTVGSSIDKHGGTHWMLLELDLTNDEVHIYEGFR